MLTLKTSIIELILTGYLTGPFSGAIVSLEQELQKTLLYLACRHHVPEVVLKGTFEVCVAVSSGPEVLIFKRLREEWPKIDQTKFSPGVADEDIALLVREDAPGIVEFVRRTLSVRVLLVLNLPNQNLYTSLPGARR